MLKPFPLSDETLIINLGSIKIEKTKKERDYNWDLPKLICELKNKEEYYGRHNLIWSAITKINMKNMKIDVESHKKTYKFTKRCNFYLQID